MSTRDPLRGGDASRWTAYALILIGTVWLLAAIGFIPVAFLRAGAMLWPLVVIGLGLDLLEVRRVPSGIPYSVVALLVIAVVALFLPPAGGPTTTTTTTAPPGTATVQQEIEEPLGDANRSEVVVDASQTSLLVRGGASEGLLLEATALGDAQLELSTRGRSVRRVEVDARHVPAEGPRRTPASGGDLAASAEIRVTDRIPVELDVSAGDRPAILNLSGLDLASFRYEGGEAPSQITLGVGGPERYDAHLTGGSGPIDLTIPEGARLNLRLEPGPGGAAVAVGARSDLTLILRAGRGPAAIDLPDNARIRVSVEDPGQGIVSLSERLVRVRGAEQGEEEDVYETAGFREVVPTIDIRIEETGPDPVAIR